MTSITRKQESKYQYRSIAAARTIFCGYGPRLYVSVPEDLNEIKNLALHLSIVFDPTVASPNRKIYWIGGAFTTDGSTVSSDQPSMVYINETADSNRRIDVTIDISHLISLIPIDDNPTFDQPNFELTFVTDLTATNTVTGVVELWKVDMIYTTKGIQ